MEIDCGKNEKGRVKGGENGIKSMVERDVFSCRCCCCCCCCCCGRADALNPPDNARDTVKRSFPSIYKH